MKKRIAFVCPRFAEGGTVGGAETLLKNLADRAATIGCDVLFLTTCARNHFTWENTLPAGRRTVGELDVHFFPVNEGRDLGTFLDIQDSISRGLEVSDEEEQAWIDHNVNSDALCDHLRTHGANYDHIVLGPYLFGLTWHAGQIHPEKTFLIPCLHDEPFAHLRIMHELFLKVRGLLFNTQPEQDLAHHIFGIADNRCHIVGMGLDDFNCDPQATALQHGIHGNYIIYCGRREPLKGIPQLLDFVSAYRQRTGTDIALVCTGSGPIESPPELAPHIIDLGFVSEQEKRDAMAGAVAFCHPSVNESLGIVLLEAWLAGTPSLVNAYGDVLRYQCQVSNGGLWFRNYPEFEAELDLLLRNHELRNQLGQNGRDYVLHEYAWSAVESRMIDALDL